MTSEPQKNSSKFPIEISTIDQAYEIAGGRGKYQILVAALCWIAYFTIMGFMSSIPYFLIKPTSECYKGNGKWEICNNPCQSEKYRLNSEKHFNFVTEFDLYCKDVESTYLVSAYFIGSLVSCLFAGAISDYFGRLPMLTLGNLASCILLTILVIFPSYYMALSCSGLIGFFTVANSSSTIPFVYDSFPSKYANFYGTTVAATWGIGQALITAIMWTGIEWRIMCYIIIGISASFFIFLIWVRESPTFYYCKGNYQKAEISLRHIAKINGKPIENEIIWLEKNNENSSEIKKITEKFCSLLNVTKIIMFAYCFTTACLVYYAINLNVEKMGGNVHMNGFMLSLASILSAGMAGFLWNYLGKKKSLALYFAMSSIGVLLQGIFWDKPKYSIFAAYCTTFGSNAACSYLLLLISEVFPVNMQSGAMSIIIFVGRLINVFSKPLALLNPLLMCIFLSSISGLGIIITWLLPIKKPEKGKIDKNIEKTERKLSIVIQNNIDSQTKFGR